jgi:hypothetical protein
MRHVFWKEADIKKCRGKGIICPADRPIYGRSVLTCETSLYFQKDEARTACSRRILFDTPRTGYKASVVNSKWIFSVVRTPGQL